MKLDTSDRGALQKIAPTDARAYLVSRGWQGIDRISDKVLVFGQTDDDGREWEILLPLRTNVADYAERMAEAIAILARVEQRSELSIHHDITIAGDDVLRLRVPEADAQGTIGLQDGVALYEQAQDLLLAAACAAIRPQASYYHTRKMSDAVSYINNVRLGQTERGSYVLTLLSPVSPAFKRHQEASGSAFEDDPFSRKVTWQLATALDATQTALIEATASDDFAPFEQAVQRGVSANLCEAISQLSEHGNGIDVSLTWARTRPTPNIPHRFQFSYDQADVLKEAARQFRHNKPRLDETIFGYVTHLNRDPVEFDGIATVRAMLDNRAKSIRVTFAPSEYSEVIGAFDNRLPISLEGDLYPVGQRLELRNPRNLFVWQNTDDEILTATE